MRAAMGGMNERRGRWREEDAAEEGGLAGVTGILDGEVAGRILHGVGGDEFLEEVAKTQRAMMEEEPASDQW